MGKHITSIANTCVVLDRSISMSGKKIEAAKDALVTFIQSMNDRDYLTVLCFDSDVEMLISQKQKRNIDRYLIDSIQSQGSTSMYKALEDAYRTMKGQMKPGFANKIMLFTDGEPTDVQDMNEYEKLAKKIRSEGMTVSCLGIGDYKAGLMVTIADVGGGWMSFIRNSRDIREKFQKELRDAQNVVLSLPILWFHKTPEVRIVEVQKGIRGSQAIKYKIKEAHGVKYVEIDDIIRGKPMQIYLEMEIEPLPIKKNHQIMTLQVADRSQNIYAQQPIKCHIVDRPNLAKNKNLSVITNHAATVVQERQTQLLKEGKLNPTQIQHLKTEIQIYKTTIQGNEDRLTGNVRKSQIKLDEALSKKDAGTLTPKEKKRLWGESREALL